MSPRPQGCYHARELSSSGGSQPLEVLVWLQVARWRLVQLAPGVQTSAKCTIEAGMRWTKYLGDFFVFVTFVVLLLGAAGWRHAGESWFDGMEYVMSEQG